MNNKYIKIAHIINYIICKQICPVQNLFSFEIIKNKYSYIKVVRLF